LVEDGSISNECFDVVVIPTDVKTKQSWYPNDTATISSTQSGDKLAEGGTVVFTLYSGDNCGVTSGSVLYKETKSNVVPSGGAASVEVGTGNPGHGDPASPGGPATSYLESTDYGDTTSTTTAARSWKVEYTKPSGDNAHTNSSSSCTSGHTEKHSYTYTNDRGAITP
jgi:hypothetical protein